MYVLNFMDVKIFVNILTPCLSIILEQMKGEIMGILIESVESYLWLWSI